jgi:hypothetical protein
MPFGTVTLIFYWPKKFVRASQRLALISGTAVEYLSEELQGILSFEIS